MQRLVLVGAGHAHLEVLRTAVLRPFDAQLVVVSLSPQQIYSGMMPGQLRGAWSEAALTVDVPALCRAAGARFVESSVERIDAVGVEVSIRCANGEQIDATHASCDIGAVATGIDLPGVREYAHRTRPLVQWRELLARADELTRGHEAPRLAHAAISDRSQHNDVIVGSSAGASADVSDTGRSGTPAMVHCCVVGGGPAGVELAFALAALFERRNTAARITLLAASRDVPDGLSDNVARRVRSLLAARGIRIETQTRVCAISASAVALDDGRSIASDFTVWATGAAAPSLFRASSLPCDSNGFLAVDDTLRATSGAPVWGAGDCISMASAPWMTRSGVYAVRAAPVLAHNLRVACAGTASGDTARAFVPQRQTMFILDTADGSALLCRGSLAVHSRLALWLKRWIDERFVARYAVQ